MFFRRKQNREVVRAAAEVMRPVWLRSLLMAALVICVAALYWRHFDNRLADIQAKSAFVDEIGQWSDQDRRLLVRRAAECAEKWGFRLAVRMGSPVPSPSELGGSVLFLGLDPIERNVNIVLPALVSQFLRVGHPDGDVHTQLEQGLTLCLNTTPSVSCILSTLDELDRLLDE